MDSRKRPPGRRLRGARLPAAGVALGLLWSWLLIFAAWAGWPASALVALALGSIPAVLAVALLVRRHGSRSHLRLEAALERWEQAGFRGTPPTEQVPELRAIVEAVERLAQRLETEHQRMQRFSLAASHELRNPLAAARAYLELAQRRVAALNGKPDPNLQRHLLQTLREIDRIWLLVEGLLVLSRGTPASSPPLEQRPIPLIPLLEEALEIVLPAAEFKAQTLERELGGEVTVAGDRPRLYLALFKLCDNAVRFTPRGGTVRVSLRHSAQLATVVVEDGGPGVQPGTSGDKSRTAGEEMFSYFEPGEPASGDASGGASLGLSLVQRVALSHGGSLEAELREQGGSRFLFTLPALESAAQPRETIVGA
ncbi:MAG: HAMP domain-containing sensor histidine kinase [Acidobacteriota bacterium]|nr:HAMP domain-containing sensor histidine kinase [Acidobacteriota bacterium]